MIPRIIHYCWFGAGKQSDLIKSCIKSWHKYMPDYKFVLWNEETFDISQYPFVKEAYEARKFAFVADVVRLYALVTQGGVYLDTDIEVLRPLDDLLNLKAFMGFEQAGVIQTGVIGSEPSHPIMKEMLNYYLDKKHFSLQVDGSIANSTLFAQYFASRGIILLNETRHYDEISLFASDYFCPINQATQEIVVSPNTYTIHYLVGSWLPTADRVSRRIKSIVGKTLGFVFVNKLRMFIISIKKWI